MAKVGIMGAGSWGTAISWLLTNNGHEVTVWSIDAREVEMLDQEREHKTKLPGVRLQDTIRFTNVIDQAIQGRDFVVLAVPSPFTRSTAQKMRPYVSDRQILVNVAKGIEETTLMTLSEQIEEEIPQADVAVLSGPSHAEEVGKGLPTTCVVGARTRKTAEYLQKAFMSEVFRVYTSPDIREHELSWILKECHCSGSRNCRRTWLWGQYKSSPHYTGHCGDRKTGSPYGRKDRDIHRIDGDRGSDRDLCKCPQPEPQSRLSDRTGQDNAGGHGRGQDGSRRRLFSKGSQTIGLAVPGFHADCGAGQCSTF